MAHASTNSQLLTRAKAISQAAEKTPAQSMPTRRNFRNITDQVFGSLVAKEYVGINGRVAMWKCVCKCGNFCLVTANHLLTNNTRYCIVCSRARLMEGKAAYDAAKRAERLPNLFRGEPAKPCSRCKITKPLDQFSRRRGEADGLSRFCRSCVRIAREKWTEANLQHVRDENRSASQRYAAKHPDRVAEARMKCKYGIGLAEYQSLLESQGGGCAICGSPPSRRPHSDRETLCIDHDHATGAIRGLLCHQCNYGIGHFADTPDLLEKAIAYLQAAQTNGHLFGAVVKPGSRDRKARA